MLFLFDLSFFYLLFLLNPEPMFKLLIPALYAQLSPISPLEVLSDFNEPILQSARMVISGEAQDLSQNEIKLSYRFFSNFCASHPSHWCTSIITTFQTQYPDLTNPATTGEVYPFTMWEGFKPLYKYEGDSSNFSFIKHHE